MTCCTKREVAYINDGFIVHDPERDIFMHYNHLLRMTSLHIRNDAIYGVDDPYLRIFSKNGNIIGAQESGNYKQLTPGTPQYSQASKLYEIHAVRLGLTELLDAYTLRRWWELDLETPPSDKRAA